MDQRVAVQVALHSELKYELLMGIAPRQESDQESARVIRAGINQPTAAARHAARPCPVDLGRPACDAAVVATHVTQHRTVLRNSKDTASRIPGPSRAAQSPQTQM